MDVYKIGSTNVTTLSVLFDEVDREYEEDATVTASFNDAAGAAIVGAQDLALSHVSGTTGRLTLYRANHAADVFASVAAGVGQRVVVATDADNNVRRFTENVRFED